MATNKSMIEALERIEELIGKIYEDMCELNAWKKVLKDHIKAQKRQNGQDWKDSYKYDKTKGVIRIYKK